MNKLIKVIHCMYRYLTASGFCAERRIQKGRSDSQGEKELMELMGVSRVTVRQALKNAQ